MTKLLAVGSRNWKSTDMVHRALDGYLESGVTDVVVPLETPHMGAAKAITDWAHQKLLHTSTWSFPVHMQHMIGEHPDHVVVFYASAEENAEPRLDELAKRARKKGYPVVEIYEEMLTPQSSS